MLSIYGLCRVAQAIIALILTKCNQTCHVAIIIRYSLTPYLARLLLAIWSGMGLVPDAYL